MPQTNNISNKLALGTANLAMRYGLKNKKNYFTNKSIGQILKRLKKSKIFYIDTAQAYGKSEIKLGKFSLKKFNIITKVNYSQKNNKAITNEDILKSLKNLSIKKFYAVLVHNTDIFKTTLGRQLYDTLNELKKKKIINKIGYSINSPIELDNYFKKFKPDIIQAPLNVFDQRLVSSGWLKKLHKNKVEIHARSIFLQGLLLFKKNNLPKKFTIYRNDLIKWYEFLKKHKLNQLEGCLEFAYCQKYISKIILGVDSPKQLNQILNIKLKKTKIDFSTLKSNKKKLISPSLW
jgi:aryl-alcohol dehydrogenase-like predicted oxidoreductase